MTKKKNPRRFMGRQGTRNGPVLQSISELLEQFHTSLKKTTKDTKSTKGA